MPIDSVMETRNSNIERTCHWCGAQTPAAFPICQKCSRHKKSWLIYTPVAGVAISLLVMGLAIALFLDSQTKQTLAQQSLDDINNTLAAVKTALATAQSASAASSDALVKAQEVLRIAESASATAALANSQAKEPTGTLPTATGPVATADSTAAPATPAPPVEKKSRAAKKIKPKITAQKMKTDNNANVRPKAKQLVIRSPDNLIRELEKARRELATQNKEFDARNGELRFLSSTQEYENSRNLYTQPIRNTITRLEKELATGH